MRYQPQGNIHGLGHRILSPAQLSSQFSCALSISHSIFCTKTLPSSLYMYDILTPRYPVNPRQPFFGLALVRFAVPRPCGLNECDESAFRSFI